MPIDVEWKDERGRRLARYEGPPLTQSLVSRAPLTSVCLRFIDPYGNTIFNQQQLPVLLEEVRSLAASTRDGQGDVLLALARFLEQARDKVHTYVHFLGD